ncbi:hypothetical protein EHQ23_15580 [Leptospira bourretii]|uniref:Uncharacterized protein n=1 Tax=Leptospira bourretii TaxID=2484962 RepID=A0A4R9IUG8_9LEPT|nr:hypothetical protein [Leptospira bourretii]TGK86028.1 hypothetical protein EHQ23_15580 [Leptospira bourretii]TGK94925.1 hypothetical protein EHQ26_03005 [Leptospira bourretii]TGL36140.1 hypothetical protein EHQ45_07555 [Leptospira bourretii]
MFEFENRRLQMNRMRVASFLSVTLCLFLLCNKRFDGDINSNNIDNQKYYWIPLDKIDQVRINETSERELYEIMTDNVLYRKSFPGGFRKKLSRAIYIEIDKIIVYDGFKSHTTKTNISIKSTIAESLAVTFYLRHGKIIHYSINHKDWNLQKVIPPSTSDVVEYSKIDFDVYWPYSQCDSKYYDLYVLKLRDRVRRKYENLCE